MELGVELAREGVEVELLDLLFGRGEEIIDPFEVGVLGLASLGAPPVAVKISTSATGRSRLMCAFMPASAN